MSYALIDSEGRIENLIVPPQGEWQAPEGLTGVEVSDEAAIGDSWIDGELVQAPRPVIAPTIEDVVAERGRRLEVGFTYDFGDARGVHLIGTTEADMRGWDEVSKGASAAIALGQGEAPISIVTETGPVTVTALEWQQVLLAAMAARQPLYAASFALQAMEPIPSDYTEDSYWS